MFVKREAAMNDPIKNIRREVTLEERYINVSVGLVCIHGESCHNAAVMYTFFAACKVLKINPEKWLSDVFDKIPFTPKEKLSELLPQNWIKSNRQAIVLSIKLYFFKCIGAFWYRCCLVCFITERLRNKA